MSQYTENANATYEGNLEKLGVVDIDNPSSINIYPKDFDAKEQIASYVEEYNEEQRSANKEENVITYTDLVGTMMSSVSTIIDVRGIALVTISMLLTVIAGLIPAKMASKKDPVEALRSE